MGFAVLEVQQSDEFDELFRVFRASFKDPGTTFWSLFTADYRPDPVHEEAALRKTTQRMISWHCLDPDSHWIKVVDESTGKVVGGGRWAFHETGNPYDEDGDTEATWWPEGKPREVATGYLNQFSATKAKHMNRPHAREFPVIPTISHIRTT